MKRCSALGSDEVERESLQDDEVFFFLGTMHSLYREPCHPQGREEILVKSRTVRFQWLKLETLFTGLLT